MWVLKYAPIYLHLSWSRKDTFCCNKRERESLPQQVHTNMQLALNSHINMACAFHRLGQCWGLDWNRRLDSLQPGLPSQILPFEVGKDQHHILNQAQKRQYNAHWQWFTARQVLLHLRRNLRGKKSIEKTAEHIKSHCCRDNDQLYPSNTGFSPSIPLCKAVSSEPWFTCQVYRTATWNRVWDYGNLVLCSSGVHCRISRTSHSTIACIWSSLILLHLFSTGSLMIYSVQGSNICIFYCIAIVITITENVLYMKNVGSTKICHKFLKTCFQTKYFKIFLRSEYILSFHIEIILCYYICFS